MTETSVRGDPTGRTLEGRSRRGPNWERPRRTRYDAVSAVLRAAYESRRRTREPTMGQGTYSRQMIRCLRFSYGETAKG